jgi:hypothetical protein
MPLADRDPTPLLIRIWYRATSAMAIASAVFTVVFIMAALRGAAGADGPIVIKVMAFALCFISGGAMLVASRALWLSARPHADVTMRRWRRIYFLLWSAGAAVMAALWFLS